MHIFFSFIFISWRLITLQKMHIFKRFIYLWPFLVFSSCSEQGLLCSLSAQASHCSGFSCCGVWGLGMWALESWLSSWHRGLAVSQHVGSSGTRDRTRVPCIGRQILHHWATKEALKHILRQCFILPILSS